VSGLTVFLIAVGLADSLRRLVRPLWLPLALGPVTVVSAALLAALWHLGDIPLLVIAAAGSAGWVLLGARAERSGVHEGGPLAVFEIAVGALILLSGWGSGVGGLVGRWSAWVGVHGVGPDRLLMVVGVVLLQLATGNLLVRLLLGSVGAVKSAGQPQPSDKLKGGRLLGPMCARSPSIASVRVCAPTRRK
jgi:hypothetical protein